VKLGHMVFPAMPRAGLPPNDAAMWAYIIQHANDVAYLTHSQIKAKKEARFRAWAYRVAEEIAAERMGMPPDEFENDKLRLLARPVPTPDDLAQAERECRNSLADHRIAKQADL
jgi:hypothetical protein